MNKDEARVAAKLVMGPIAETIEDLEQNFYEVQTRIRAMMDTIQTAQNGEDLAKKYIAFFEAYAGTRQTFADLHKDLQDAGKKLDPVFKILDGK